MATKLTRRPTADDDYLSTREVADMLQISMQTLMRWRTQKNGPRYHKFGNRVRYRLRDVKGWAEEQRVGDRTRRR